jgi:hypothetical protein
MVTSLAPILGSEAARNICNLDAMMYIIDIIIIIKKTIE